MSLLKYNDYLTEKVIYDLLLESKIVYSKKFIGFLTKMKANNIAQTLLDLYSKDLNVQHNYIDVGSEKDTVSFTPDRKVQELEQDKSETYKVEDTDRYLTNSSGNDRIFELLGYEKKESTWNPEYGTIGIIFKEVISPRSGKIYVWFKGIDEWEGKETVLNKEALEKNDEGSTYKIWSTSRNNIKIGRLVRSILSVAKVGFTDRDIEEFVNMYKATFDVMSNALIRFDIVEGSQIAYWYNYTRYARRDGVLGNSCMADVDSEYFDIYCDNPETCKMVILYDENGSIEQAKPGQGQLELFPNETAAPKYKSDKIIGRTLLWTTSDGKRIMDRIYTIKDSDIELFKEFAKKNGIWWKRSQDSDNDFTMENGTESMHAPSIEINLKYSDFDYYPYLDTFYFLNTNKDVLSNTDDDYDRMLRDTGGGYDG